MPSLYDRKWRARRARQLSEHPLCFMCLQLQNRISEATVADHVVPHRGDPVLFAGPLQSLCKSCHDSLKQQIEKGGLMKGHDITGAPLDPRHPWNRPGGQE